MPSLRAHHLAVVEAFPCCIRPSWCAWSTVSWRLSRAPPLPISQAKRFGIPPLCHRKPMMTPRGTPPPPPPPAHSATRQRLISRTVRLINRLPPSRDRQTAAGKEDADDDSHSS